MKTKKFFYQLKLISKRFSLTFRQIDLTIRRINSITNQIRPVIGRVGFTLVELLVVISVIGVLAAVMLPNLLGVRERARDAKVKTNLSQLRNALRLFYNDYSYYPESSEDGEILGCGTVEAPETSACSDSFETSGANGIMYMKSLPTEFYYTQTDAGFDYILYAVLENVSDTDIEDSAIKCNITSPVSGAFYACE